MADEMPNVQRHLVRWQTNREVSAATLAKRRLAAAMRRVIARLVESDAPEPELVAAAEALERYAERLAAHPRPHRYEGWAETSPAGDPGSFFDHSPLIGLSNPLSPPLELTADPDGRRVHGRGTFGPAYEGPPGCVHGGYVAAAFDEVLGFANSLSGNPGMTGTLTVRYRRPTPLHTELRFEAEYLRSEGRKIFTAGKLFAGESLCAEAEGLFISVGTERFRALFEERQKRDASASGARSEAKPTEE
jgi:acyl-coenzyme A thioesterase PaaI-like protein